LSESIGYQNTCSRSGERWKNDTFEKGKELFTNKKPNIRNI